MYYLANFASVNVDSHTRVVNGKKVRVKAYKKDRARLKGAIAGSLTGGTLGLLKGLPYAPIHPAIPVVTTTYGAMSGGVLGGGIGEYLKQTNNAGKQLGGDPNITQREKLKRNTQRRFVGGAVGALTSPLVGIDPITGGILGVAQAQRTRKYKPKN